MWIVRFFFLTLCCCAGHVQKIATPSVFESTMYVKKKFAAVNTRIL
jgi:hypothetical protein